MAAPIHLGPVTTGQRCGVGRVTTNPGVTADGLRAAVKARMTKGGRMKFACGLILLMLTGPAFGQTVVGKAVVDGKTVELLSDKSWRYTDASAIPGACKVIAGDVSFCAGDSDWKTTEPFSAEADGSYVKVGASIYGMFIVEQVGADAGVTLDFLANAVIENARNGADAEPTVLSVEDVDIGGHPGRELVLQMTIKGASFVFSYTIFVEPAEAVQIMNWGLGKTYDPRLTAAHTEFVSMTKVGEK